MRTHKFDIRTIRHALTVLAAALVLCGCGLIGGHGSVAAGEKYQAEGNYRAAYIEAKKVLQKNNKDGKAWLLLGRSSLMLGKLDDALSELENARKDGVSEADWAVPMGRALLLARKNDKLLKTLPADNNFPPKVKARVLVLRGDAQSALKQPEPARQSYQAALKIHANDPLALVGLARLAMAANNTDTATRYIKQARGAAPTNPQALVAQADLAFDSHDFASAEATYQKALDLKHPDWVPQERYYVLTRQANAQAQQNQLDKALATIKTLQEMAPQQPYPYYMQAVVLYQQGHMNEAVSALQHVLKLAPDDVHAQFLMGTVNYAQGNYAQAEMYFSNVAGVDQKNTEARKMLALSYYREGRSQQALKTLRSVATGKPSDAQLLAVLQRAAAVVPGRPVKGASAGKVKASPSGDRFAGVGKALAAGNNAEAVRLLKAMPPGDAATEARRNSLLVSTYVREHQVQEAVKTAAAYAAKHPDTSDAHLVYGTALVAAGKHDDARSQYSQAIKLDPKNVAAILSLGSLDVMERHFDAAANQYKAALKVDPHNIAAMTQLGQLAAGQGDKAGATKWFKQAIGTQPKSITPYLALAMLDSQSGKFDQAVGIAEQMVKANPDNPAALNALGAAQLNAGHHAKALSSLEQAVKLAPDSPSYRTNLARAQVLNKDLKGAAANLDQVIKAEPGDVTAVALRAFLKLQDHDLPGAIALAQSLQKQSATKAAGLTLEGDLYAANKSWDKAVQAYQQGLKVKYDRPLVVKTFEALNASGAKQPEGVLNDWLGKHPDDAAMRLMLGQYYLGHAQNDKAADEYEHVLKKYPGNVSALNNLAWIYTEQHNSRALALAGKAHKLAPDSPGVADTYGWALIAANQPKAALPVLQKAAKAAPKVPTIQYHLAVAQARSGDRAGARATLATLQKSGVDFKDKPAAEKLYAELGGASGESK